MKVMLGAQRFGKGYRDLAGLLLRGWGGCLILAALKMDTIAQNVTREAQCGYLFAS